MILEITRNQQPPLWMLQGNIPRALSDVVDRCLAKSRCDRWPSVAELAGALAPFASPSGKALVPRVCAVCSARLPAAPTRRASLALSFSDTTVDGQAGVDAPTGARRHAAGHVQALGALPDDGFDPDELVDAGGFGGTVSSHNTGTHGEEHGPRSLLSLARHPRLAPMAGPAALALGLGLFAAWPLAAPQDNSAAPPALDCRQAVTYYRAKDMRPSAGTARGEDWNLFTFGTISQVHPFARGESELTITAAGDLAGTDLPHMIVRVNGRLVAEFDVASEEFATYSARYHSPGGKQTVRIRFANDHISKGEDRNLILRGLRIAQCGPTSD